MSVTVWAEHCTLQATKVALQTVTDRGDNRGAVCIRLGLSP